MRLCFIIIVARLTACSGEVGRDAYATPAGIDVPGYPELEHGLLVDEEAVNWADPRNRPEPYRWNWRYARIEDWRGMPREIQLALQRYTKENSLCRGGSGGNRSTMRACNRRQVIGTELMKLGWCWGDGDADAFRRWLRCENDPAHNPNALSRIEPPYFSDEEINEFYEDEAQEGAVG